MNLGELSNAQIATLGVARLGGDARAIDTEDIALVVYEIAPKRFSWRKYPDRIDLHTVRVALADALRLTPPLLRGGIKDGWMLSPEGLRWISGLPTDLGLADGIRRGSVLELQEAERARLHRTTAFTKFHSDNRKNISLTDFCEFVRINEYFPKRKRKERFAAVENAVSGDPKLTPLWRFLKRKFRKEITPNEP